MSDRYQVALRSVRDEDLELLLAWAWIPSIWVYMPTSRRVEVLTWEHHYRWWQQRRNRKDWMILLEDEGFQRRVGVVHIDFNSEPPEIGLYIGEITLHGKGIGKRALEMAIEESECNNLVAVVNPQNGRSVALFEGLGFKYKGGARHGQTLYGFDKGSSS